MGTQTEEKKPSALSRIAAAIKAGAHMIDVEDVKEALNLWGAHHKFKNKMLSLDLAASNARVIQLEQQQEAGLAAYREQCEAVNVLKARNIELESSWPKRTWPWT